MAKTLLFSEFRLRDITFKNRIVASPMWQYVGEKGRPTDWHLMHLGRLADGGAGLVFQEGTTVERRGSGTRGDLGFWDDAVIPAFARIATLIRNNGAVPGIQLMHAGRKARTLSVTQGGDPLHAQRILKTGMPGRSLRRVPSRRRPNILCHARLRAKKSLRSLKLGFRPRAALRQRDMTC
jgi:2,4-dienoyl-CoA reductase-like NADH-dependent reductase (Old Yellow Enzyme family)